MRITNLSWFMPSHLYGNEWFRPFQEIVNHFRLNAPELMPALAEFRGNLTGEGFKHFCKPDATYSA